MVISLIHPSRGRPDKAYKTMQDWWGAYTHGSEIEHILSIDHSDPFKKDYLKKFHIPYRVVVGDNDSVVQATNRAAAESTGDILIYLSDDFKHPDYWRDLVLDEFKKYSGPTLIKVDDCLQLFTIKVLTIPIMNRELYNRLGYFWHEGYKSQFVDEDLYWTAEKLGALKFAPHLKFPHIHPANPNPSMRCDNDETYRRSAANWDQGKALFAKRKAAGFPV